MRSSVLAEAFEQCAIVACLLLLLGGFGKHAFAGGTLTDYVEAIQRIQSIHVFATVDARAFDPELEEAGLAGKGAVIEGTFEYWASGQKYRIESYLDPTKYPGMNTVLAYDGVHSQLHMRDSGMLALSAEDTDTIVMSLPNPIVEMIQFLKPVTDETEAKRVRLKDLAADGALLARTVGVEWQPVEKGVLSIEQLERAVFPGGVYEGNEYEHHVYATPRNRGRPIRIDRVRVGDGHILTSTHLSHYVTITTPDGDTHWPRHVTMQAFSVTGELAGQLTYVILTLELNQPIEGSLFTLSPDE